MAVALRRHIKKQRLRQEIMRRLPILAKVEKERRLRRAQVGEVEDNPEPPLETLPYDSLYVMDYTTDQTSIAVVHTMFSQVKDNLLVETVMNLWSRRIVYGEYAVT